MAVLPENAIKIILPAPYYEGRLSYGWSVSSYNIVQHYRQRYEEEHKYERWYEDTKGWYHDPEWKYRLLSIQSAHDGNHPVWIVAHHLARWGYIATAMGPASSFFMFG
jgi:hypothetical protein